MNIINYIRFPFIFSLVLLFGCGSPDNEIQFCEDFVKEVTKLKNEIPSNIKINDGINHSEIANEVLAGLGNLTQVLELGRRCDLYILKSKNNDYGYCQEVLDVLELLVSDVESLKLSLKDNKRIEDRLWIVLFNIDEIRRVLDKK